MSNQVGISSVTLTDFTAALKLYCKTIKDDAHIDSDFQENSSMSLLDTA